MYPIFLSHCYIIMTICVSGRGRARARAGRTDRVTLRIGQAEQSAPSTPTVYLPVNVKFAVILASSPGLRRSSGFSFGSTLELTLLERSWNGWNVVREKEKERRREKDKKIVIWEMVGRDGGFVSISSTTALNDLALGNLIDTGQTGRPDFKRVRPCRLLHLLPPLPPFPFLLSSEFCSRVLVERWLKVRFTRTVDRERTRLKKRQRSRLPGNSRETGRRARTRTRPE